MRFVAAEIPTASGRLAAMECTTGPGPTLVFCHATGFCKEVWTPVIEELEELVRGWTAVAVDQRLHGGSQGFPPDFDWWRLGDDVVAVAAPRDPVIGIGHSGGGTAVAMAEVARPGTFAAALLIEPIIFPPPYRVAASHPLAEAARRRRRRFASRDAAYANYHGKGPFSRWDERALRAFVEGGFDGGDGGVVLRCSPEAEAQFFLHASAHGMWERLEDLDIPIRLMAGAGSDSHPSDFLRRLEQRIPTAASEIISGATHFVPMESPGVVAARIAGMIEDLGAP